jgi:aminopeptidase YwaD
MHKLLLAALFAPLASFAQVEEAREITKTLCSPEFHGRGYVNGGDSIAAEYIARQFGQIGCRFFKQGQFQPFTFDVNTFPGEMTLAVNGRTLKPGIDYIVDPSSGGGTGNHQHAYLLPVAAIFDPALLSSELRMLIETTNASTGEREYPAVIVYTAGLKGDSLRKAMKLSSELTEEFTVLQATDAKFTWSVGDQQYKHPLIQVSQNAFDVSETDHYVDVRIEAVLRSHTARNVIAYAPAKRRSKKYIVFSAHYDHLGRMGQATYFPGGNDNASGTAMLLALARHFVENPSDVNVVFMSFAGEEAGLIGSHYYVQHPYFPLKRIRFLTNVDIMGSGEEGITVVNATLFPKQFDALQDINKEKNLLGKIGSRGPAANSDHYFFTEAGVPAFFFYTMGPNKHYHDVQDTYEELSFSEFTDIYRLLIDFAGKLPELR